ncbi:MAG: BON domain-containing protein [Planctomycetia bacterium]|nr:BON domain-containing protein [Planctomycetia bacterium]
MITRACFLSIVTVLTVGTLPAGEPPASAIGMIRDLRMSLQARRVVQTDPLLRDYKLGVEVKAGVARVWGTLPDNELSRRALSRIEHIDGIRDVISELKTAGPIVVPDGGFKTLKGPTPMTLPVPPSPAVVIVPAETKTLPAPAQTVKRDGLAERIRQFQTGSLERVRFEVLGRIVIVYRGNEDEAAGRLASLIREIDGVDEVRLER